MCNTGTDPRRKPIVAELLRLVKQEKVTSGWEALERIQLRMDELVTELQQIPYVPQERDYFDEDLNPDTWWIYLPVS